MTPSDRHAPTHSNFPESKPVLEYVTLSITAGSHGQTVHINPQGPDTDSAAEAAKTQGLCAALNRLAEYGYRLLEGTVLHQNLNAAEGVLFMYRER
jgi:hypothetical protein